MMDFKKIILILLCVVMISGMLVSCDQNERLDADTSSVEAESSSDTESDHAHEWSKWQVVRAATYDSEGEETRVCSCGGTETRTIKKI